MKHRLLIFGSAAIVTFTTLAIAFPAPNSSPPQMNAPTPANPPLPPLPPPSSPPTLSSPLPPQPPIPPSPPDAGSSGDGPTAAKPIDPSLPSTDKPFDADMANPDPSSGMITTPPTTAPMTNNTDSTVDTDILDPSSASPSSPIPSSNANIIKNDANLAADMNSAGYGAGRPLPPLPAGPPPNFNASLADDLMNSTAGSKPSSSASSNENKSPIDPLAEGPIPDGFIGLNATTPVTMPGAGINAASSAASGPLAPVGKTPMLTSKAGNSTMPIDPADDLGDDDYMGDEDMSTDPMLASKSKAPGAAAAAAAAGGGASSSLPPTAATGSPKQFNATMLPQNLPLDSKTKTPLPLPLPTDPSAKGGLNTTLPPDPVGSTSMDKNVTVPLPDPSSKVKPTSLKPDPTLKDDEDFEDSETSLDAAALNASNGAKMNSTIPANLSKNTSAPLDAMDDYAASPAVPLPGDDKKDQGKGPAKADALDPATGGSAASPPPPPPSASDKDGKGKTPGKPDALDNMDDEDLAAMPPPPGPGPEKSKGKTSGKNDAPVGSAANVTVLSTGSAAAGVPLLTHSELADVNATSKTVKSDSNNKDKDKDKDDTASPLPLAPLPLSPPHGGDKFNPSLSDPVFNKDTMGGTVPDPLAKDRPASASPPKGAPMPKDAPLLLKDAPDLESDLPPLPDAAAPDSSSKEPLPASNPISDDEELLPPLFSSTAGVGHFDKVQSPLEAPYMVANDTLFSYERLSSYEPSPYENRYRALDDFKGTFDIPKHWGHLSPYFSSPMFPEMQERKILPQQCNLKQVHMLHRNGAHMPAMDSPASHFAEAIANTTMGFTVSLNATGPLTFLNHWKYDLGVGGLTAAGAQQMFDSGVQSYYRYGALFNESRHASKPVLRTTSQHRMVDSASHWAMGMYGLQAPSTVNLEVIVEDDGYNNTLADSSNCPNANDESLNFGDQKSSKWIRTYLKGAVRRLSRHLPKMHLTPQLVFGMQTLCAYETFTLGESNFCHLFTMKEWEGFEYASDLLQRGNDAFGSPTARAESLGYLVELLARIENKTPSNNMLPLPLPPSLNKTLDDDAATFPVDQPIHVDFTHHTNILHLLTALNFSFLDAVKLTEDSLVQKRAFYASHIVPFAARLVFEVIDCPTSAKHSQSYIRTLLNDAILPMGTSQGCSPPGPSSSPSSSTHKQSSTTAAARKDGLCPLDDFLAFFKDEVIMGNWGQEAAVACHGKNGTDFIVPEGGPNNGTVAIIV